MSDDVVIRAEGLGKKYLIGHQGEREPERYVVLRDIIARGARGLWRKTADMAHGRAIVVGDTFEEFWALKDVSFEVRRGEVLGIIGRNGAGKSTFLKILSRITEPTEGRVTIKGRVASLLEVGTGFHPELTGRENIYLNGAILGMRRAEVRRKFDEIVAFAELDKFLDTPVKRYSSGMYVRLAFAVAAHLEPEILIVDEVLAVGDFEFQKKCLGKMGEVSRQEGRTVLFVSHNMGVVASLCQNAVLLKNGYIADRGPARQVIQSYTSVPVNEAQVDFPMRPNEPSITNVSIDHRALRRGDLSISVGFASPHSLREPVGGIVISNILGTPVWASNGRFHENQTTGVSANSGVLACKSVGIPLAASVYTISAWLGDWYQDFDEKLDVLSFHFRPDNHNPLRPDPTSVGHLDWQASWEFRGAAFGNGGNSPRV